MNRQKQTNPIYMMVALPCEAKPLVRHFRLQRLMQEKAFVIYQRDGLFLTVTGPGKVAMSAGLAYTFAVTGKPENCSWLNVGVAGSRENRIGEAFLAHKVSDLSGNRHWYPGLCYRPPGQTQWLCSVDQPETVYPEACLYDMEASAFFETGARFTSLELLQSVKVVSDNPQVAADQLNANLVTDLIADQITLVCDMLAIQRDLMKMLPAEILPADFLADCQKRWHLTDYQSQELEGLLRRWFMMDEKCLIQPANWPHQGKTRLMLAWLRQVIAGLPCAITDTGQA